jgi:hypothetical protein
VLDNHTNWHTALSYALWADRVTPKVAIGNSLFFLVYEREAILLPNVLLPSLQLSQKVQDEEFPTLENRINALLKLEETRAQAKHRLDQHQQIVDWWFGENSSFDRKFNVGYLVLRWDKAHEDKGEHTKFQNLWLGPFIVIKNLVLALLVFKISSNIQKSFQ